MYMENNKYKLINITNKEETLCDKVTIDGFDYYEILNPITKRVCYLATNNPNIDIPKVVDEVEAICIKDLQQFYGTDILHLTPEGEKYLSGFKTGYNKSQETHPFSEEDMIEFAIWRSMTVFNEPSTPKGELKFWKEQKPKIVYYE